MVLIIYLLGYWCSKTFHFPLRVPLMLFWDLDIISLEKLTCCRVRRNQRNMGKEEIRKQAREKMKDVIKIVSYPLLIGAFYSLPVAPSLFLPHCTDLSTAYCYLFIYLKQLIWIFCFLDIQNSQKIWLWTLTQAQPEKRCCFT